MNSIERFNNTVINSPTEMIDEVLIFNHQNVDFKSVRILGSKKRNFVIIDEGVVLKNTIIDFRSEGSIVYIKSDGVRANFLLGFGSCVYIGQSTSFTNSANILASEGYDVYVGDDCMFAENVNVTNSDGHPIYDKNGVRLNEGGDIIIGNHVWIGRNSDILKNTILDSGCIIGSRSVVTKNVPFASVAVGAPAEVKKTDVIFSKETTVRHKSISYNHVKAYTPEKLKGHEKEFLSYIKNFFHKESAVSSL